MVVKGVQQPFASTAETDDAEEQLHLRSKHEDGKSWRNGIMSNDEESEPDHDKYHVVTIDTIDTKDVVDPKCPVDLKAAGDGTNDAPLRPKTQIGIEYTAFGDETIIERRQLLSDDETDFEEARCDTDSRFGRSGDDTELGFDEERDNVERRDTDASGCDTADTRYTGTDEESQYINSLEEEFSSDDDVRDFSYAHVSDERTPRSLLCDFQRDDFRFTMDTSALGQMDSESINGDGFQEKVVDGHAGLRQGPKEGDELPFSANSETLQQDDVPDFSYAHVSDERTPRSLLCDFQRDDFMFKMNASALEQMDSESVNGDDFQEKVVDGHAGLQRRPKESDELPFSTNSERLQQDSTPISREKPLAHIAVEKQPWQEAVTESLRREKVAIAVRGECSADAVRDVVNDLCFVVSPNNANKSAKTVSRLRVETNRDQKLGGIRNVLSKRPLSPFSPKSPTRKSDIKEALCDLCFIGDSDKKLERPENTLLIETAVRGSEKVYGAVKKSTTDDSDGGDRPFDEEESLSHDVTKLIEDNLERNGNSFASSDLIDLSGNVSLVVISKTMSLRHPVMSGALMEDNKFPVCGAWQLSEVNELVKDVRTWADRSSKSSSSQQHVETVKVRSQVIKEEDGNQQVTKKNSCTGVSPALNKAMKKALGSPRRSYSAHKFSRNRESTGTAWSVCTFASGTASRGGERQSLLGRITAPQTRLTGSVSEHTDRTVRSGCDTNMQDLDSPSAKTDVSVPFDEACLSLMDEPAHEKDDEIKMNAEKHLDCKTLITDDQSKLKIDRTQSTHLAQGEAALIVPSEKDDEIKTDTKTNLECKTLITDDQSKLKIDRTQSTHLTQGKAALIVPSNELLALVQEKDDEIKMNAEKNLDCKTLITDGQSKLKIDPTQSTYLTQGEAALIVPSEKDDEIKTDTKTNLECKTLITDDQSKLKIDPTQSTHLTQGEAALIVPSNELLALQTVLKAILADNKTNLDCKTSITDDQSKLKINPTQSTHLTQGEAALIVPSNELLALQTVLKAILADNDAQGPEDTSSRYDMCKLGESFEIFRNAFDCAEWRKKSAVAEGGVSTPSPRSLDTAKPETDALSMADIETNEIKKRKLENINGQMTLRESNRGGVLDDQNVDSRTCSHTGDDATTNELGFEIRKDGSTSPVSDEAEAEASTSVLNETLPETVKATLKDEGSQHDIVDSEAALIILSSELLLLQTVLKAVLAKLEKKAISGDAFSPYDACQLSESLEVIRSSYTWVVQKKSQVAEALFGSSSHQNSFTEQLETDALQNPEEVTLVDRQACGAIDRESKSSDSVDTRERGFVPMEPTVTATAFTDNTPLANDGRAKQDDHGVEICEDAPTLPAKQKDDFIFFNEALLVAVKESLVDEENVDDRVTFFDPALLEAVRESLANESALTVPSKELLTLYTLLNAVLAAHRAHIPETASSSPRKDVCSFNDSLEALKDIQAWMVEMNVKTTERFRELYSSLGSDTIPAYEEEATGITDFANSGGFEVSERGIVSECCTREAGSHDISTEGNVIDCLVKSGVSKLITCDEAQDVVVPEKASEPRCSGGNRANTPEANDDYTVSQDTDHRDCVSYCSPDEVAHDRRDPVLEADNMAENDDSRMALVEYEAPYCGTICGSFQFFES